MSNHKIIMTAICCAECGEEGGEGGVSLKVCMACMSTKYCNAACQRKHWPSHKKDCKLRAAKLRDEALFEDPPPKEECPICFLPMSNKLISCASLPPATMTFVPIYDFANANKGLATKSSEQYYSCCGKSMCRGCDYSFCKSGNDDKCPFCNSNRDVKTYDEMADKLMKRVEANDPTSTYLLAYSYQHGLNRFQQDQTEAIELYAKAADLGCSKAHFNLGNIYNEGGDLKKAKFHFEAAAMVGHEGARFNIGLLEGNSGKTERAVKHWTIAASAGYYDAMHNLRLLFKNGFVSRESMDSTLAAYNNSCDEFRSGARDACIHFVLEMDESTNNI
jgi:tetratricopeptide (TPR) repeat protein